MASSERNPRLPGEGTFGKSGALYILATSSEPLTVEEITEVAPVSRRTVGNSMNGLFRDGYVVRRERETGGKGADPYEYAIRSRSPDSEVADGE
jgi:predicted transcriptional regulator